MVASDPHAPPVLRKEHHGDTAAAKAVSKADKHSSSILAPAEQKKGPAGGYDETPIPQAPPGYTIKITFHRAENLPFADFNSFSSDPYLVATMSTKIPPRHKQDPKLRFRTPTIRKNTEPVWEAEWIVANIPSSGFQLKCRLYDEDPADHDDRLGNVHVLVDHIDGQWSGIKERSYTVQKRMGSKRAYLIRGAAVLFSNVDMNGRLVVSVEVLGRTPDKSGGRVYTVGPCHWSRHFSPLFGRLVGTKDPESVGKDGHSRERYNFQANQIQLRGPTPDAMYHRYVEFRPFIKGMFTATTLKGRILNRALHHQHARIYNYDRSTIYGCIEGPSEMLTKQFLDLAHWDKGGRIFTYVITLDGQMRFTETGKEFGIDLLSKHTMHADCDNWIAFSGEFFIRRLKHQYTPKDRHNRTRSGLSGEGQGEGEGDESRSESPSPFSSPFPSPLPPGTQETESQIHLSLPQTQDRARASGSRSPPHSQSQPQNSPHSQSYSTQNAQPEHRHWWSRPHSQSHSQPGTPGHPPSTPISSTDPRYYHLIIDNDSGTYRPNANLLPQLRRFLRAQFPNLRISTLDCVADAERMSRLKKEQYERKKRSKGGKAMAYVQMHSSSDENTSSSDGGWSSSDEDELRHAVRRQRSAGSTAVSAKSKSKSILRRLKDPKAELLEWASGDKKERERARWKQVERQRRGSAGMEEDEFLRGPIRRTQTADGPKTATWDSVDTNALEEGADGDDEGPAPQGHREKKATGCKRLDTGVSGANGANGANGAYPHSAPPDVPDAAKSFPPLDGKRGAGTTTRAINCEEDDPVSKDLEARPVELEGDSAHEKNRSVEKMPMFRPTANSGTVSQ